jgi:hypothetical protein
LSVYWNFSSILPCLLSFLPSFQRQSIYFVFSLHILNVTLGDSLVVIVKLTVAVLPFVTQAESGETEAFEGGSGGATHA